MGQWVNWFSELKLLKLNVAKASIYALVKLIRPETKWSNHEQAE